METKEKLSSQEIRDLKAKLNLHIAMLTVAHLGILAAWLGLSQLEHRNPRLVLCLLILTSLTWLWLVVTASRRWSLWRAQERKETTLSGH